jgi:small-conductance mechanosensitive channel
MARKFVRATILLAGLLFAFGFIYQVSIAAVATSLGITGLVIALSSKDSLENLVGSLNLLFDMPFAIGDYVRFDKFEGAVEDINLRATRIRTSNGTVLIVPNGNFVRAPLENFGPRKGTRVELSFDVPISAADRLPGFRADLQASAAGQDPGARICVGELCEKGIEFSVRFILPDDAPEGIDAAKEATLLEILRIAKKHRIEVVGANTP